MTLLKTVRENRKSNKRDGEMKKRAHSVPSLVDSCDGSHDITMDDSTPSIVADNFDDNGNDVSAAFQEYAQILVNQSTASQNLKLRAHDEKLEALLKEVGRLVHSVVEKRPLVPAGVAAVRNSKRLHA